MPKIYCKKRKTFLPADKSRASLSFADRIRKKVKEIPKGKVSTYAIIAEAAGNPKAARAAGTVLRRNKDLSVPCHRVVNSDGRVGKYNGILRETKEDLLKKEGVNIIGGFADLNKYLWGKF